MPSKFRKIGCKINAPRIADVRPAASATDRPQAARGDTAKTGGIYARVKRNKIDLEAGKKSEAEKRSERAGLDVYAEVCGVVA